MRSTLPLFLAFSLSLVACAKGGRELPGDSVGADGGVSLASPAVVVGPRDSKPEPLGPVESKLFPPELIMENQATLGITETQRKAILDELDADQKDLLHLQWELQGEKEKLVKVLDVDVVDEKSSAEAANHLMVKENAVKAAHLRMLVRVKNLLTPAQQAKLREIRAGGHDADGGAR